MDLKQGSAQPQLPRMVNDIVNKTHGQPPGTAIRECPFASRVNPVANGAGWLRHRALAFRNVADLFSMPVASPEDLCIENLDNLNED